ncbi:hypothetical protein BOX15_Mlig001154g2, partial [Macrostomum lignano]
SLVWHNILLNCRDWTQPPWNLSCSSPASLKSLEIRSNRMPIKPIDLTLLNKEKKEFSGKDLLPGKKIMLYFSAHWCPPCRSFTPVLAKFYAEAKAANKAVECVFVSCDRDEASMWSYMNESHGDYYVVPFDAEERKGLSEQYGVSGIPCLVVVDEEGKVLQKNARNDVQAGNVGCIDGW